MKEQQKLEPVPGPWVAVGKVVKSDCGRDSVTVTRVDSRGKFVEGYDEANARLIAAAPDMYKLLEKVREGNAYDVVSLAIEAGDVLAKIKKG
jgi:hypothetical protein